MQKTLAELVNAGETVWLVVDMEDFASPQDLNMALASAFEQQVSGQDVYIYVERDGRVLLGSDDVELTLTIGGDGVYGELVASRGDGSSGTVHVALDLGAEEVRCLVD